MSDSIKINGVEHGLRPSSTNCGNIDLLFLATKQAKLDSKTNSYSIPGTDDKTLDRLRGIIDEMRLWASSGSGAIGVLLANIDHEELDSHDMKSIGWLLAGLSELQYCLADAQVVIDGAKAGAK